MRQRRSFASFVRLAWLLAYAGLGGLSGCEAAGGLAFTPGTHEVTQQPKAMDRDTSARTEEEVLEEGSAATTPVFGASFVVGGQALDAGVLPKPPIPVVILP